MNIPQIPGTVLGIDCYHEDAIDDANGIHAIVGAGYREVRLKLGEGTVLDPTFASRFERFESVGANTEAYWFVRPDVPASEQFALIRKYLPENCRLWLDLEPSLENPKDPDSDRWLLVSLAKRQSLLAALVGCYKAVYDAQHPGLYATPDFWLNVLGAPDGYQKCPWWAPRYSSQEPAQAVNLGPWVGWQCSENETVPGFLTPNSVDVTLWRTEALTGLAA